MFFVEISFKGTCLTNVRADFKKSCENDSSIIG